MATTPAKRACPECGTLLPEEAEFCLVCALRQAAETQSDSVSDISSEIRFEHYTVLQNAEGKPFELGRGAMGITYKAFDVRLQRPAALKIINFKAPLQRVSPPPVHTGSPGRCQRPASQRRLGVSYRRKQRQLLLRDGVCRG